MVLSFNYQRFCGNLEGSKSKNYCIQRSFGRFSKRVKIKCHLNRLRRASTSVGMIYLNPPARVDPLTFKSKRNYIAHRHYFILRFPKISLINDLIWINLFACLDQPHINKFRVLFRRLSPLRGVRGSCLYKGVVVFIQAGNNWGIGHLIKVSDLKIGLISFGVSPYRHNLSATRHESLFNNGLCLNDKLYSAINLIYSC